MRTWLERPSPLGADCTLRGTEWIQRRLFLLESVHSDAQNAHLAIAATCSLTPEMPSCFKQPSNLQHTTKKLHNVHTYTYSLHRELYYRKKKRWRHIDSKFWILFPLMAAGQPKFLHIIHCYSHRCFCSALREGEKEKKVFYRSTNSSTCPVANGENMSMWIIVLSPWIKISLSAFKIPLTETTAKSIRYLACYAGIK